MTLTILFFVLSLTWLFVAINVGDSSDGPSGPSGVGKVKLWVLPPPNKDGGVVTLNVIQREDS